MARKRSIKASRKPAIVITRHGLGRNKLVYVAKANKPRKYRYGRSAIVYIGTTKAGVKRIADSAAAKAELLLRDHGVKHWIRNNDVVVTLGKGVVLFFGLHSSIHRCRDIKRSL